MFDRVDVLLGAELLVQLAGVLLLARLLRRPGTDQVAQRLDRFRDQSQSTGGLFVLRRSENGEMVRW